MKKKTFEELEEIADRVEPQDNPKAYKDAIKRVLGDDYERYNEYIALGNKTKEEIAKEQLDNEEKSGFTPQQRLDSLGKVIEDLTVRSSELSDNSEKGKKLKKKLNYIRAQRVEDAKNIKSKYNPDNAIKFEHSKNKLNKPTGKEELSNTGPGVYEYDEQDLPKERGRDPEKTFKGTERDLRPQEKISTTKVQFNNEDILAEQRRYIADQSNYQAPPRILNAGEIKRKELSTEYGKLEGMLYDASVSNVEKVKITERIKDIKKQINRLPTVPAAKPNIGIDDTPMPATLKTFGTPKPASPNAIIDRVEQLESALRENNEDLLKSLAKPIPSKQLAEQLKSLPQEKVAAIEESIKDYNGPMNDTTKDNLSKINAVISGALEIDRVEKIEVVSPGLKRNGNSLALDKTNPSLLAKPETFIDSKEPTEHASVISSSFSTEKDQKDFEYLYDKIASSMKKNLGQNNKFLNGETINDTINQKGINQKVVMAVTAKLISEKNLNNYKSQDIKTLENVYTIADKKQNTFTQESGEKELKNQIVNKTAETISQSLFGESYTQNKGRVNDTQVIKEILELSIKDRKVADFEITKNEEKAMVDYIKSHLTKSTVFGIITGGIQLKELTSAEKELTVKNFQNLIVKKSQNLTKSSPVLGSLHPDAPKFLGSNSRKGGIGML